MTARRTHMGLLAALVMLAMSAATTDDRASAQVYGVGCSPHGYWVLMDDLTGNTIHRPGSYSRIPCTEPKPSWNFGGPRGEIRWLTPDGNPDSNTEPSNTGPSNTGPPGSGPPGSGPSGSGPSGGGTSGGGTSGGGTSGTGPSDAPADTDFLYEADETNRAVRAADGQCYRQQRLNGQWRRSGTYGSSREACRQASWNAYYRSQGRSLVSPRSGLFESGWPPGATIWSSTLTVDAAGADAASWGCSDADQCGARLTSNSFTYRGTEYSVESIVYDPATRTLLFTLDQEVPEELTLQVGDLELAVDDADATDEGARSSVSWVIDDDLEWTSEVEVSLRLRT